MTPDDTGEQTWRTRAVLQANRGRFTIQQWTSHRYPSQRSATKRRLSAARTPKAVCDLGPGGRPLRTWGKEVQESDVHHLVASDPFKAETFRAVQWDFEI